MYEPISPVKNMTSEHRKTHIPILSWGMPVEVWSSSACGSNVMAAACSMSLPIPVDCGVPSGLREHELPDSDRHEDRSEDQGRGEEDPERLPFEFQVHEVERDEHRFADGDGH